MKAIIEKAKLFQDEFSKTHHEAWNRSRHGIAVVMTEFVLSLEQQVEGEKKRLKEPQRWQCVFYQQHGISCSNPIRKNGDCIGINCGYFKTQ